MLWRPNRQKPPTGWQDWAWSCWADAQGLQVRQPSKQGWLAGVWVHQLPKQPGRLARFYVTFEPQGLPELALQDARGQAHFRTVWQAMDLAAKQAAIIYQAHSQAR